MFIPQSLVMANTAPQSAARREGTYISVLVVCAEAVFNTYGLMGVILLVPCSHRLSEIQAFFVVVVAFVPSRIQQTLKPPKDFKKRRISHCRASWPADSRRNYQTAASVVVLKDELQRLPTICHQSRDNRNKKREGFDVNLKLKC